MLKTKHEAVGNGATMRTKVKVVDRVTKVRYEKTFVARCDAENYAAHQIADGNLVVIKPSLGPVCQGIKLK